MLGLSHKLESVDILNMSSKSNNKKTGSKGVANAGEDETSGRKSFNGR